ncbi:hypothetical protein NQ318_003678 [Aromia moschata]|uniref:Uncharacterized protein n=1 Tax=Aromia moschata TaxID=1265417 RepID=A0AAV8XJ75_9CUCU|nr:hypothetical protein NQ318_003678 [Aromia moschata]
MCQRILKSDLELHPYRLQSTHEILRADEHLKLQFYHMFINYFKNNDAVFEKTFFFTYWLGAISRAITDNPHFYIETPLHSQTIGVWAVVSRTRIVGPTFFAGTLNAESYRLEILTPFEQILHDDELQEGYIQQAHGLICIHDSYPKFINKIPIR